MILLKYGKHVHVKCLPEEISTTKRGEKGFPSKTGSFHAIKAKRFRRGIEKDLRE
ncbi:hypothetical protein X975_14598, partial [Stegodyphus mimosarum]